MIKIKNNNEQRRANSERAFKQSISCIIPVLNEEVNIKNFLDSYITQSTRFHEVIIVVGMCTDNTINVIQKYQKNFRDIKLFVYSGDSPAAARNFGLSQSTGEYVIFMDADWKFTRNDSIKTIKKYATGNQYIIIQNIKMTNYTCLRKYIYLKDRNVSFKIIKRKDCPLWNEKLGFGEDRMFSRDFAKKGYKTIKLFDLELGLTRAEGDLNIHKLLRRYIWYGRTMSPYLEASGNNILDTIGFSVYVYSFLVLWMVPFIRGFINGLKDVDKGYDVPFGMGLVEVITSIGLSIGYFQYGMGNRSLGRDG